ncbi:hypothetical protein [Streptomyces sp. NPDC089795]|uniref:hypothetical protein n=1 Tax=Streptomyces sp. NPDC089795 TaxID=3155297 RepID=UPI0034339310
MFGRLLCGRLPGFAAIEVLGLTGVRNEELRELTHHSITEDRLPSTVEVVPLLRVAPFRDRPTLRREP